MIHDNLTIYSFVTYENFIVSVLWRVDQRKEEKGRENRGCEEKTWENRQNKRREV